MPRQGIREEEFESRWEAGPAIVVVIVLQLLLAIVSQTQHWSLWNLPWWVWLVPIGPEIVLLVLLAWERPRRMLEQSGHRRTAALMLLGFISLGNTLLLVAVLGSLIQGTEKSGAQLLTKAMVVWGSNVITFGLWFWEFDRGGPVRRLQPNPPLPDFEFPQLANPELAPRGWRPHFVDYLYVSFTNSIAFSPTDTLPLTHSAKCLMLLESAVSAFTILLLFSRAVNIFR